MAYMFLGRKRKSIEAGTTVISRAILECAPCEAGPHLMRYRTKNTQDCRILRSYNVQRSIGHHVRNKHERPVFRHLRGDHEALKSQHRIAHILSGAAEQPPDRKSAGEG